MLDLSMLDAPAPTAAAGAPLWVPASALIEDPDNPRTVFDEASLTELAEDIRARGILQPIVARPPEGGQYMIRFGARRFRAGLKAGLTEFPVLVASDARQFDSYAQVAENHQREGLSPLELAAFIQRRLAAGEKRKDIAGRLRLTPTALTFHAALIDAPALLMELYHSGRCRSPEYLYRLRNLHARNAALVEARCATAGDISRRVLDEIADALERHERTNAVAASKPRPGAQAASPAAAGRQAAAMRGEGAAAAQGRGATQATLPAASCVPPAATPAHGVGTRARYNVVMVRSGKRAARLLLHRRASGIGRGWIQFSDDGSEAEVELARLRLDSLLER